MNLRRRDVLKWTGVTLAASPVAGLFTLAVAGPGLLEKQREAARREGIPLIPEDLKRNPPVPESENAGPLLKELTRRYSAIPEAEKRAYDKLYEAFSKSPDDPAARAALQKGLVSYTELLALAERASALPHCDMGYDFSLGPNLLFPEFAVLRHFARMFAARAWLATEADAAWEDIARTAKLGNLIFETPCIIAALVGVAIHGIADRAYIATLKRFGPSSKARETLQAFGPPPEPEHYFGGEVILGTVAMKLLREGKLRGGEIVGDSEDSSAWRSIAGVAPIAAPIWEKQILLFWREAYPIVREVQRTGRYEELGPRLEALGKSWERDRINVAQNLMALILFPVFSQATTKTHVHTLALRRLRETALALSEEKAKTGAFPATSALPTDPFSPEKQPLRYKKESAGCVLYSVGQDEKDDGGVEKRTKSSNGLDLVVRL